MKHGWWLVLLWLPTVAQAWEEEPALGFILAYTRWSRPSARPPPPTSRPASPGE